jgi:mRNA interferase RelE/StbE
MTITFTPKSEKEFLKLDFKVQKLIKKWQGEIESLADPRSRGKSLSGGLKSLWRYRVEDYRIICDIQDDKLIVLVLKIGHRSEVYSR